MSTTFVPTTTSDNVADTTTSHGSSVRTSRRRVLWVAGLVSGAAASLATSLMVVVSRAADVPVAVDGEQIPILGFAQMTMVGAIIGTVLATVLWKRAQRPQRTFVVTTVVLTALSLVPDLVVDASVGSKLVLMATHLVAAAIVVPTLAKRLAT